MVRQCTYQLTDDLIGDCHHLVVGSILNRVRSEYSERVEAESGALGGSGITELHGGGEDRRDASSFKIVDVVHTARRTRASISERLDHSVALAGDFVAKIDGCRFGEGGFAIAIDLGPQGKEFGFNAVEKYIASRFGDVEQTDGEAL